MRILVTGFEPFGSDSENASGETVERLRERWSDPVIELVTAILPVSFAGAPARLGELLAEHRPDAVLALGEAGRRAAVTPERGARNLVDARIPDNDGAQPRGVPIDDGPERRAARFDVDAMVEAIRAVGVRAEASDDAGGFVCNRIAYELARSELPGGFLHVPAVRSRGVATVGAETGGTAGAGTGAADASALGFDELAHAAEAAVRSLAEGVAAR
ncbi:pyroglutamyl-peptidase I family protein [Agromyces mediolanus]|uniref:pyroglutamyl-peptidase I family protein n=1 Tax=Agromyces mediolanus TaxID=41986 RepID=UPI001E39D710|nr:pyroglutamyl-peptidase I [Agromyces mediolanus]MCD1573052.1 pyroglutamyl-peptidase I [Agromyces mediolanus]